MIFLMKFFKFLQFSANHKKSELACRNWCIQYYNDILIFLQCRLNGSHIWIGGGFVPPFVIKDPLEVNVEGNPEPTKKKTAGGIVLKKTWFFDGFSWIPATSMSEERNKAACSLLIDQNGEVQWQFKLLAVKNERFFLIKTERFLIETFTN